MSGPQVGSGPLTGLRIIEVASFVAAPLGGMTLAQLGADVIRVDPLGGAADRRRWPLAASGASIYWAELNKGKRSVTVDFRSPTGRELVADLIAGSGPDGGIVVTNQVSRAWLSYQKLVSRRLDLIHVAVLGRRDGGPAVDYTVNAETGFPYVTGPAGQSEPVNHVLPAWDVTCGLYAGLAVLVGERQRRRTGKGRQVSIALSDVALAVAGHLGFLAEAQVNGADREKIGNHLYGSFARDFATRDGRRVMVVALTSRQWHDLVQLTGVTEPIALLEKSLGVDFSLEGSRFRYREVLAALIGPWFEQRSLDEVSAALAGSSVLWSPYRRFTDVVDEGIEELLANPMIGEVDQPDIGRYLVPGSPLAFVDEPRPVAPAPRLGEHTADVLGELLALSGNDLDDLRARGVIDDPSHPSPGQRRPPRDQGSRQAWTFD